MKRGVEIMLGARLEAATGEEAILKDGTRIPTRTLVSTVPSSPHPIIEGLNLPKGKNGRLIANKQLEVEGAENIWAVGDCAQVPTPKGDSFCPPTAQHAIRQARTAAHNIVAQIRGSNERQTFAFEGLGTMGALGYRSAVAEIFGMKISGFLAWWIWRTIYLMKLPGWGRRLKVASSWTLDLFLPAELVELKLTGSMGITNEHFEPGEAVFHQGDLGDRIYIIVSGQAEVVREVNGMETVLATLGAGEYFGEMALLTHSTRNATVRCTAPMNTMCLPKREFGMLAAYLPQVRETLENVMAERQTSNAQKAMKADG
jgi:NADH dehydrogenase